MTKFFTAASRHPPAVADQSRGITSPIKNTRAAPPPSRPLTLPRRGGPAQASTTHCRNPGALKVASEREGRPPRNRLGARTQASLSLCPENGQGKGWDEGRHCRNCLAEATWLSQRRVDQRILYTVSPFFR